LRVELGEWEERPYRDRMFIQTHSFTNIRISRRRNK